MPRKSRSKTQTQNTVKVAPVEVASVDVSPVEVAPVEVAPVEVAPVEVAPVDTSDLLQSTLPEESYESLHLNLIRIENEIRLLERSRKALLKSLMRTHKREVKHSRKKRRSNDKRQLNPSGFNKPGPVPQPLIDLLGLDSNIQLPRTKITGLIYGYIKEHKLHVPEDKRTINPNTELQQLFQLNDGEQISFYNIQTHIKKLYTNMSSSEQVESVVEPVVEPVKQVKKVKIVKKVRRRRKKATSSA